MFPALQVYVIDATGSPARTPMAMTYSAGASSSAPMVDATGNVNDWPVPAEGQLVLLRTGSSDHSYHFEYFERLPAGQTIADGASSGGGMLLPGTPKPVWQT
jgi:hypothetical protein